jgi:hypothetical protein
MSGGAAGARMQSPRVYPRASTLPAPDCPTLNELNTANFAVLIAHASKMGLPVPNNHALLRTQVQLHHMGLVPGFRPDTTLSGTPRPAAPASPAPPAAPAAPEAPAPAAPAAPATPEAPE